MEQTFFKVMTEHEGYAHTELDGLTMEEAQEFLGRMNKFFPNDDFWIEEGTAPMSDDEYRTYSKHVADGWEDFYSTDEG